MMWVKWQVQFWGSVPWGSYRTRWLIHLVAILALTVGLGGGCARRPPAEKPPANVAGKWTIYTKAADGETSTKYIELKQDGNTITGHFKGPNQSGGLEGTINEEHIVFRTKRAGCLYSVGAWRATLSRHVS